MKKFYAPGILMLVMIPFVSQTQICAAGWTSYNSAVSIFPVTASITSEVLLNNATHDYMGFNKVNNENSSWVFDKSFNPEHVYLSFNLLLKTNTINFDRFEATFNDADITAELKWSEDNFKKSLGIFKSGVKGRGLKKVDLSGTASVKSKKVEFRIYFSKPKDILSFDSKFSDVIFSDINYIASIWVRDAHLPLSAEQFRSKVLNENTILFKWETLDDPNISGFSIERSLDGISYSAVGSVSAEKVNSRLSKYHFTDRTVMDFFPLIFYYRLKMNKSDEKFTYSKPVAVVKKKKEPVISVLSETSSEATVHITAPDKESVKYFITDNKSRIILNGSCILSCGLNSFAINTSKIKKGNYTLYVQGNYTNANTEFNK